MPPQLALILRWQPNNRWQTLRQVQTLSQINPSYSICRCRSKTCLPSKKHNTSVGSSLQSSQNPRSTLLLSCECRHLPRTARHFIFNSMEKAFGGGGSWVLTDYSMSFSKIFPGSDTVCPGPHALEWRLSSKGESIILRRKCGRPPTTTHVEPFDPDIGVMSSFTQTKSPKNPATSSASCGKAKKEWQVKSRNQKVSWKVRETNVERYKLCRT